jgi:hypothetical protein
MFGPVLNPISFLDPAIRELIGKNIMNCYQLLPDASGDERLTSPSPGLSDPEKNSFLPKNSSICSLAPDPVVKGYVPVRGSCWRLARP